MLVEKNSTQDDFDVDDDFDLDDDVNEDELQKIVQQIKDKSISGTLEVSIRYYYTSSKFAHHITLEFGGK